MADIIICSAIDVVTQEVILLKDHDGKLLYNAHDIDKIHEDTNHGFDAWASGCCAVVLESEESLQRRGTKAYARLVSCQERLEGDSVCAPPQITNDYKQFSGNMFYASTLFGLAVASLSIKNGESYHVGEKSHKVKSQEVEGYSKRDGDMSSLFIIDNK